MTASITDLITKVGEPGTLTTLQAPGKAKGATSILLSSPVNWPTITAVYFCMQRINIATGIAEPGSYTVWKGILNGSSIDSLELKYGDDQAYAPGEGVQVFIYITTTWANSLVDGILLQHNANGTHKKTPGFYAPTATIWEYAGSTEPEGWKFAAGQYELRTDYPDLFTVIGTTYNLVTDNDVLRFRFPNKKGRVGVGLDAADTDFNTLGKSGGQKDVKTHMHGMGGGVNQWVSGGSPSGSIAANINQTGGGFRVALSGTDFIGSGSTNMNPYLVTNYIIKI